MEKISYCVSSELWADVVPRIENVISRRSIRRVVELGGGANPSFDTDFIEQRKIEYTLLDISREELEKAPDNYSKVQADVCDSKFSVGQEYDLAFSRMLAEHVRDGEQFHRNVHSLLRPGGIAIHFFPTLYAPPFVANYLLPEKAAAWLLHALQPGRQNSGRHGKFPAYYQWCRGPTSAQIKRFESLGFEVESYVGSFGHRPYYQKIPVLRDMHGALAGWLSRHAIPELTSFALVVLVKKA